MNVYVPATKKYSKNVPTYEGGESRKTTPCIPGQNLNPELTICSKPGQMIKLIFLDKGSSGEPFLKESEPNKIKIEELESRAWDSDSTALSPPRWRSWLTPKFRVELDCRGRGDRGSNLARGASEHVNMRLTATQTQFQSFIRLLTSLVSVQQYSNLEYIGVTMMVPSDSPTRRKNLSGGSDVNGLEKRLEDLLVEHLFEIIKCNIRRTEGSPMSQLENEDRSGLKVSVKVFISSLKKEALHESLDSMFSTLDMEYIDSLVLAYPSKSESSLLLAALKELWQILEDYVERKKIHSIGVSDVDTEVFIALYGWAKILWLDKFVGSGIESRNFDEEREILPRSALTEVFGSEEVTLFWALRFQVHLKCRGVLASKGYVLCEVVLRVSHSFQTSSDRTKPRSGDWVVMIDLQEAAIASLANGSNVKKIERDRGGNNEPNLDGGRRGLEKDEEGKKTEVDKLTVEVITAAGEMGLQFGGLSSPHSFWSFIIKEKRFDSPVYVSDELGAEAKAANEKQPEERRCWMSGESPTLTRTSRSPQLFTLSNAPLTSNTTNLVWQPALNAPVAMSTS
uniref:GCS light chain n=1 Tax=Timema bartmani TaxID=61472 RepID=A0A7R9EMK7_9NEOP|nr:unnamed protein product [Timema bartmani]